MNSYQDLSLFDVALAAMLIVVNGALSVALKLRLERQLLIAALRTIVQLLLIGYVLGWVFSFERWYVVLPLMALMTVIASFAASGRGRRSYAGQHADSIVSIWGSTWIVGAFGLFVVIRIHPWYEPQSAIPILGMILGNTLTGVSLGIERMTEELTVGRAAVEMSLALGATRWEAVQRPACQAVRAGMIPTLNQMAVVGLVSLPGMMTGQVLAGQSPLQAVRYQIVIMFLIAAAVGLGVVGAILLTYRRLFSPDHRFLQRGHVELDHASHRAHGAIGLVPVGVLQHRDQPSRSDLPRHAETVRQPTARHRLAAVHPPLPVVIDLVLRVALHEQRDGRHELEFRSAVERHELLTFQFEHDCEHAADRSGARLDMTHDLDDARAPENADIVVDRLFGTAVEPQTRGLSKLRSRGKGNVRKRQAPGCDIAAIAFCTSSGRHSC